MKDHLEFADGDGANDLLIQVERAFGIQLTDSETIPMETLGDLADGFALRLRAADGPCVTSMAFYRLRRAARALGLADAPSPSTSLSMVLGRNPRSALRDVSNHSALALPGTVNNWMGYVGGVFALAAVVALISLIFWPSTTSFVATLTSALGATVFILADRGRPPAGLDTFGDLVRRTAALNMGRLTLEGAAMRPDALFPMVREIVADALGVDAHQLGRDTRFFPEKQTAAA